MPVKSSISTSIDQPKQPNKNLVFRVKSVRKEAYTFTNGYAAKYGMME